MRIDTIVDVGANKGQFARQILKIFPHAQIHSFEPLPSAFEALKGWAASRPSVNTYNVAVGDSNGFVNMNFHTDHGASSSILNTTSTEEALYPMTRNQQTISVPLRKLDDLLAADVLEGGVLIKLDVQGYEDRVLRGGARVLERARAVILEVCLDPLYENQADFEDLLTTLTGHGYRYVGNLHQVYGDDGRVVYLDSVFVRNEAAWCDWMNHKASSQLM